MQNKKVVLHACCAPCASYPIQKLKSEGWEPVIYFYNPNIFPLEEYEIRRVELYKYCLKLGVEFFDENYNIKEFYCAVKGFEKEPEKGKRCLICFDLRLDKTALFAIKNNIHFFTTTLSISPHKNSKQIFEVAHSVAKRRDVEFLPFDFKKQDGFKISRQIAKENNMYAQNYCGCEFSRR